MFIDNYVLANLSILHVKLKSQYTMKNDVLKKKKKKEIVNKWLWISNQQKY